jgi:hypothetical protein
MNGFLFHVYGVYGLWRLWGGSWRVSPLNFLSVILNIRTSQAPAWLKKCNYSLGTPLLNGAIARGRKFQFFIQNLPLPAVCQ